MSSFQATFGGHDSTPRPAFGTAKAWAKVQGWIAAALEAGTNRRAVYGPGLLDDRSLRDIGITRRGIRETTLTHGLEARR